MPENDGYKFWKDLGSPRLILAPMVDQSELAWRMLGRKYGAELCYTPMLHASVFVKDARYRRENLLSCAKDRPLIMQFCANDPDIFVEACKFAVGHCDGVDLNLGCPQAIARRGHYGAFLQEEWDLLMRMVSRVHNEVDIPVTCKIRVFEDVSRTVKYAQMLEAAGCQLLTVHGRTKEQKGPFTGLASWKHIKAVKDNVTIPVFANGNIQSLVDVEKCFEETGVDGVMIAEGSLHNPALFKGLSPCVWDIALEYLTYAKMYPCPLSYVRGHIFKLCHHCLALEENKDTRQIIASGNTIEEFTEAIVKLKEKYETQLLLSVDSTSYKLPYPPWICQPYVRPSPAPANTEHTTENPVCDAENNVFTEKRSVPENSISRKKLKKLQKNPEKQFGIRKFIFEKCQKCLNPKGTKCSYQLCKACCRKKSIAEILDCVGHRFQFHAKEKARLEKLTISPKDFAADASRVSENVQSPEEVIL